MSRTRRPGDAPRRLLTDWTTSAGVAGDGLLALVAGEGVTPEGIHLATLGYEVFVLAAGDDLSRVHHVDVPASELPAPWHERFALVVTFDPEPAAALAAALADGGLMVVIGVEGHDVALPGLAEVTREVGPDPNDPAVTRYRLVMARV
ncbi:hypothetical protein GCM10009821_14800 [Aeromicrobium halocynthiae]|uniref:Uncharacterized protein n=1 Tax=Aeromicrobium halocynthiae TaxID=560557 RepID=A0ABN2VZN1_9ACTN